MKSILLVGPTGAGKTPLGRVFEEKGFHGHKVHHFDFGEELRKISNGQTKVNSELADLVRSILAEGRLLSRKEYYIFISTLKEFLNIRKYKEDDLIALNGFPRDLDQAQFIEDHMEMLCLVYLQVNTEVLYHRLKNDPAGDRKGRWDDTPQLVEKKLKWFYEKNLPLLEYYQKKGVKVLEIPVERDDTGESLYQKFISLSKQRLL